MSLLAADDKHLFAGTSEEAILYKVGLDGRAEALADFDAEEVRALARFGGSLYAAVNDFERSSGGAGLGGPGAAAAPKGTKITAATSGSPASAGSLPRPGQRKAKAALYRLDADGRMEQMFSIPDGYFTTLAFDDAGRAYVGTGSEGRVYRISADRTAALAIDVSERQALALLRAGNGFLVGTGDVGGVYRAMPAAPRQATYLSRVLDGEYRSRWGLFRWHGSHDVAIESRSGNTAKPDTTWTGFAALEKPRPTAEGGVGQVASPPARYVQYRATLRRPRRTAGRRDARLPAAEPARAHHRARPGGQRRARARDRRAGGARRDRDDAGGGARAPDRHQAALEGGEPRRRRAELPARLPRGERGGLAPAGRARPADQDRIRLEHRGAARRDLRRQGHRQRRALRAARPRAGHDVHVRADPGRQPQARGASGSR